MFQEANQTIGKALDIKKTNQNISSINLPESDINLPFQLFIPDHKFPFNDLK